MIKLLEKLMDEKFEDTFKPIDRTEQAKRRKEYAVELKTYDSEILKIFFEEVVDDVRIAEVMQETTSDNLDLWIEAMQSDEFKKNAIKRLLEYLDDMVQDFKEHMEWRQEMEEEDETQNM